MRCRFKKLTIDDTEQSSYDTSGALRYAFATIRNEVPTIRAKLYDTLSLRYGTEFLRYERSSTIRFRYDTERSSYDTSGALRYAFATMTIHIVTITAQKKTQRVGLRFFEGVCVQIRIILLSG